MLLLATTLSLFATHKALAWGGNAHTVTTLIAERHLTPEAKEGIARYLNHTLPFYAIWMDTFGTEDPYREKMIGHCNFAKDTSGALPDNEQRAASVGIERIRKDMKDLSKLSDSLIRINLLMLIHAVADIHCPGHTYVPREPKVSFRLVKGKNNQRVSYHSFWDNDAFTYGRRNWRAEQYADAIDKLTPKQAKKIVKGPATKWYYGEMIEIHNKAIDMTPRTGHINAIPKEVRLEMRDICDERVVVGGYRLAHIMNEIFKH